MTDKNLIDSVFDGILKKMLESNNETQRETADNIFYILQTEDKERFHSRFLCYLIKAYYDDFKEYFTKKGIVFPDGELKSDECCCEFPCGKIKNCKLGTDGFIDVYLPTESGSAVAIEVKWYADDQPTQLLRYKNCLRENKNLKNPTLIYLSLGKEPSEKSIACGKNCERCGHIKTLEKNSDYFKIAFGDILKWINEVLKNKDNRASAELKMLAGQYANVLANEINGNMKKKIVENEIKKIVKLNNVEDVCKAVINIKDGLKSLMEDIPKKFFEDLEGCARARVDEYKVINQQDPEFEQISDGDSHAIFACVDDAKNGFAICCETNIYCYKISEWRIDGEKWSYITQDWFKAYKTKQIEISKEQSKGAICGKVASEALMTWYFSNDDDRNAQLEKILEIAMNSCKAW